MAAPARRRVAFGFAGDAVLGTATFFAAFFLATGFAGSAVIAAIGSSSADAGAFASGEGFFTADFFLPGLTAATLVSGSAGAATGSGFGASATASA